MTAIYAALWAVTVALLLFLALTVLLWGEYGDALVEAISGMADDDGERM